VSYAIFLDDTRDPPGRMHGEHTKIRIARSFEQFNVLLMRYGCPRFISFDYDLGPVDVNPSGVACAKLLIELVLDNYLALPDDFAFAVHSMNPDGAARINSLMHSALEHLAAGRYGDARKLLKGS